MQLMFSFCQHACFELMEQQSYNVRPSQFLENVKHGCLQDINSPQGDWSRGDRVGEHLLQSIMNRALVIFKSLAKTFYWNEVSVDIYSSNQKEP